MMGLAGDLEGQSRAQRSTTSVPHRLTLLRPVLPWRLRVWGFRDGVSSTRRAGTSFRTAPQGLSDGAPRTMVSAAWTPRESVPGARGSRYRAPGCHRAVTCGCRVPACAGIYRLRPARCSLDPASVLKPSGGPPSRVDFPPSTLRFGGFTAPRNIPRKSFSTLTLAGALTSHNEAATSFP